MRVFLALLVLLIPPEVESYAVKARTTENGCTYEYIETSRDDNWDKCYKDIYFNCRKKVRIWKNWPDLSIVTDTCCDRLQSSNYCFAVQFFGECHGDARCDRYKKPSCRKPPYSWLPRVRDAPMHDKLGGILTNSYYCAFKCGYSKKHGLGARINPRIVEGVEQEVWPWMGALYYVIDLDSTVREGHFCGATLISCRWVLTAARCIFTGSLRVFNYFASEGQVKVLFGTNSIDKNAAVSGSRIKQAFRYPDADIALMELEEPMDLSDDVHPICLNDEVPEPGTEHTVLGWGKLKSPTSESPSRLMGASTVLRDDDKCPSSDKMLCFEERTAIRGWCSRDEGGPLLVQKSDGRWYQTGIASTHDKININGKQYCAYPGYKQMGINLANTHIRQWIHDVTGLLYMKK